MHKTKFNGVEEKLPQTCYKIAKKTTFKTCNKGQDYCYRRERLNATPLNQKTGGF